jgi:hypothetical protein
MSRIHDFAGIRVPVQPPLAEENQKPQAAPTKPTLFQVSAGASPLVQKMILELKPPVGGPAPNNFVSLASLGVVSSPLTAAGSGHIPEQGPTGETMPFYDQGDSNGCGTTSLSMILKYFGIDISREAIDAVIRRTDSSAGSNPGDLIEFARDNGLEAEGYNNGTWEQLKSMIDEGYPCMASIGNSSDGRHLIVITGYETGPDGETRVLYHDPELGDEGGVAGTEQSMSLDEFKEKWGKNDFGLTNYFMAFGPEGADLPAGSDKGAEGALGTHAGAVNFLNGFDRIFSPDSFGSFVHGFPQLVGGALQTVGCGLGALFQAGGSWLGGAVEGIPVLENIVQPFTDLFSGVGAVVADVFNGIGEAFDSVGGAFESLFEGDLGGFAEGLGDAVGDVAGGVADAVGDAVGAVGDAIGDIFSGW